MYIYSLDFADCQSQTSGGSRTQSSGVSGSDPCFKVGLFSSFYFDSIHCFSSVINQDIGQMVRCHFDISEEIEHSFGALQHVQTVILALLVTREPEALERVRMHPPTVVTSAGSRIIGVQVCP